MENEMFGLADQLQALRERKAALADETAANNAAIEQAERDLSDRMAETETQNFTRAGRMFSLVTKSRASAIPGQKAELFAALRVQGFGDLVYETVNANSLSSFVNEQRAENGDELPAWLENLVKIYEQVGVSVRKTARK